MGHGLASRLSNRSLLSNSLALIGPEDPLLTLDSAGQQVSTDQEAASRYDLAVRMTLGLQRGVLEQVDSALEADPGCAVAHATKAALDFEQRDLRDCALHYHSALESLARGATARECRDSAGRVCDGANEVIAAVGHDEDACRRDERDAGG